MNVRSICAIALFAAGPVAAQGSAQPSAFSSVTARAGVLHETVDSRLRQLYRPSAGFGLELSTPFDLGHLGVSLERSTFRGVEPEPHPDFRATLALISWRVSLPAVGAFTVAGGVHAGAMQFSFDDSAIDPGLRKERELVLGVNAVASVRLTRHLSAFVAAEYSHVWLHVPMHVVPITAGIGYTVSSPEWLRDFLR